MHPTPSTHIQPMASSHVACGRHVAGSQRLSNHQLPPRSTAAAAAAGANDDWQLLKWLESSPERSMCPSSHFPPPRPYHTKILCRPVEPVKRVIRRKVQLENGILQCKCLTHFRSARMLSVRDLSTFGAWQTQFEIFQHSSISMLNFITLSL